MKPSQFFRISAAFLLVFFTAAVCNAQKESAMAIDRISASDALKLVKAGDALLVCSYSDSRCKEMLLERAIFLSEFESQLPTLPKTQQIIFYCA